MQTKTCSTCGETKPIIEFHKGKRYKDGYRGQCKECTHKKQKDYNQSPKGRRISRESAKRWREENPERRKAYRRWHYYEGGGREYFQRYYSIEKNKQARNEAVRKYHKTDKGKQAWLRYIRNNPEKQRAKAAVNNAVQSGRFPHISTQICNRCGEQAEHYHHWSYKKEHWLDVEPLCIQCHVDHHIEQDDYEE